MVLMKSINQLIYMRKARLKYLTVFTVALLTGTLCTAQQRISAVVLDEESLTPVPFASVVTERGTGVMADSTGKFSFMITRKSMLKERLLITASGFVRKRLQVQDLVGTDQVLMQKEDVVLDDVRIFSSVKADPKTIGFYRVWNDKRKGGEIGYIFNLQTEKILIEKVQFKVNHNYNACRVRLHIRDVSMLDMGFPRNDLLKKETDVTVTNRFGTVQYDLDWEEIQAPGKKLYIGFELLDCDTSLSSIPSFFYLGHESGQNFFREATTLPWQRGGDYTIYIRFFYKNAQEVHPE